MDYIGGTKKRYPLGVKKMAAKKYKACMGKV